MRAASILQVLQGRMIKLQGHIQIWMMMMKRVSYIHYSPNSVLVSEDIQSLHESYCILALNKFDHISSVSFRKDIVEALLFAMHIFPKRDVDMAVASLHALAVVFWSPFFLPL